ncbi:MULTISPECIES: endonuclease domain-containing protein [unclassified Streptomyces]|uniref:endonuclease domain-containing protein n=1 Tax=unclassified Streptomyces TaxID=2593676 RepID=UPI0027E3BAC5|nr:MULTISPECIES: endonuclease domain-containing protein [unclassified Streptomyces]
MRGAKLVGGPSATHCKGFVRDLPLEAFARYRNRRDGPQPRCRECVAEHGAAHDRRPREALVRPAREKAAVPAGRESCRTGGEAGPHRVWHRNASASDGLTTRRTVRRAIRGRQARPKRQYGIAESERDRPIAARGGVCRICSPALPAQVDHCHETGRVRGVRASAATPHWGSSRISPAPQGGLLHTWKETRGSQHS